MIVYADFPKVYLVTILGIAKIVLSNVGIENSS